MARSKMRVMFGNNNCLRVTYLSYTLSKQEASPYPALSHNNKWSYAVEPPFSDAKSTQLDILKFVFMSACYLSDLRLNIAR